MNHLFTLPITPIAAPRQVNSDRWRPCDRVIRYREWRDDVTLLLLSVPPLPDRPYFVFDLPMPPSWSKKRRERMTGTPHRQKPDIDNLIKAVLDTVYRDADDSHVWSVGACKRWAGEGAIHVYEQEEIILSEAA